MRQYFHTAFIILAFACSASGQFTDIWTTTNMFAVNEMASQCYSASVERCNAVGVTPSTPSWWDYMLGKNRAKLLAVKKNIYLSFGYFVNPRTNALDLLVGRNTAAWTSVEQFLQDCSLPTNALAAGIVGLSDPVSFFKTQYPDTTGGWYHCWVMLTNMVHSQNDGVYISDTNGVWQGVGGIVQSGAATNWTLAKAEAEGPYDEIYGTGWRWEDVTYAGTPFSTTLGVWENNENTVGYLANNAIESYALGYQVPTSSPSRSATAYHLGGPSTNNTVIDSSYYPYITTWAFDTQGATVSNGWWKAGDIGESPSTLVAGPQIGILADQNNDPGFPPNWCDDPQGTNAYSITTKGWATYGQKVILNWVYSTNGFKYR